jgi:hypothetical protein
MISLALSATIEYTHVMLFERQRLLLALVGANGGKLNRVDLQKLLFLYTQTCEQAPSYEFVPFKKGAYSFTAVADKAKLTEKGFLSEGEDWHLTESGSRESRTPAEAARKVALFSERRRGLRGNALIASTYRSHPYWATRSRIASTVLQGDSPALAAIARAKPERAAAGLASIGYEGCSLEGYLNTLLKAGVSVLCDVRKNPLSRKFGFSRKTLSHACAELDIRYEHLPQLGIASDARQDLKSLADYQALFRQYEQTVLANEPDAVNQIAAWVTGGACVALTCYEAQPEYCHRTRVARAVGKRIGAQVTDL